MSGSAVFEIFVESKKHSFSIVSFRGKEALSKTYSFEVELRGDWIDPEAIETELVGRPAHLRIFAGDEHERWVHGGVLDVALLGPAELIAEQWRYRLRLVPALRFLGARKGSRIFQDKTVPEIVALILGEAELSLSNRLTKSYGPRSYCVQHQESELRFIERILAEEGIFFWFEHAPGSESREVLVLADSTSACEPIASGDVLHVGKRGDALAEADLRYFELTHKVTPTNVRVKDYDHQRPSHHVHGDAPAQVIPLSPYASTLRSPLEQYHHLSELEPEAVTDAVAATRLEQHRRKHWLGRAEGRSTRVLAGRSIRVDNASLGEMPDRFTVVEISHEAVRISGDSATTYLNRFLVVPHSVPFRPPPPRRRVQQILESAVIVGPPGSEIHTDNLGRVKVQFHWDRLGKTDDHSSCWIRVAMPWTGAGFGFQFIPRVGTEVVIGFLGGDTDKPIIVGSAFNREQLPPFTLPTDKTKSGIVTRSTPRPTEGGAAQGAGYNELSFQDQAGQETITLRAERDLNEQVQKAHTTVVGADRDLTVKGTHKAIIEGASTTTIGKDRLERAAGNRHVSVGLVSSHTVEGNMTTVVGGHHSVEVAGLSRTNVEQDAHLVVSQQATVSVKNGLSLNVGTDASSSGSLHAGGNWNIGADGQLVLNALKGVTIQCGESLLHMAPDGIQIAAKVIELKATDAMVLRGKDGIIELAAEAKIASPKTRLFGSSASVEVTTNAYITGAQIKLGERDGDPPKVSDETAQVETQTLSFKVTDGGFQAIGNRPWDMVVDGVRYSGTTGGDGSISQDVPASATEARLIVWKGDPPSGEQIVHNISLASLPSASSLDGARARLRNLGYETGKGDELDTVTARSLLEFQDDHELEPTGELDGATSAKLTEAYGA